MAFFSKPHCWVRCRFCSGSVLHTSSTCSNRLWMPWALTFGCTVVETPDRPPVLWESGSTVLEAWAEREQEQMAATVLRFGSFWNVLDVWSLFKTCGTLVFTWFEAADRKLLVTTHPIYGRSEGPLTLLGEPQLLAEFLGTDVFSRQGQASWMLKY